MDQNYFLQWALIGLSIAAPVWPIGVLCIKRSLSSGWASGFATGLWAATADGIYAACAAFGIAAIAGLASAYSDYVRIFGIAFLGYLGWKSFRSEPATEAAPGADGMTVLKDYATTVVLTMTNPATILSFVAIFAGAWAFSTDGGPYAPWLLVAGTFVGSALWWLGLSFAASSVKHRFNRVGLRIVNRASWAVIIAFAAFLAWGSVAKLLA